MRRIMGEFRGAGGIRLFRQSWLPDGEPRAAIVTLHGLGDHSGLYGPLVEHFTGARFSVHAYDARGNGRSDGQRAYIERWSELTGDLGVFLDIVRRESRALPIFVVGTSLGGLVAIDFAAERPRGIAGVVALAPPLGELSVPKPLLALGRMLSRVWPRFSLETGMDLSGLARDPAVAAELLGDPLFHRVGTARLATETEAAIARVRALRSYPVPLLLVHGAADRMVTPEGTRAFRAALAPGDHALLEIPGAFHALAADTGKEQLFEAMEWWMAARIPAIMNETPSSGTS